VVRDVIYDLEQAVIEAAKALHGDSTSIYRIRAVVDAVTALLDAEGE
jgi:hypothetical protein